MKTGIAIAMSIVAAAPLLAQEPQPPAPPEAPRPPRVHRVVPPGGSYLGVGVADLDAERAKALKLSDEHGVEVRNVSDDSPAAKAGVKENDVILEYNGQRVEGKDQLIRMVKETPPGRQVRLQIWRNGAAQTVTLTMGKRSGGFTMNDGREFTFTWPDVPPMPPMPDMPRPSMSWRSTVLGVESESLNSQLAQYFGVKEGVLVRSVVKGSSAEKAGIKAGDVILKVDGTTVTSPREISSVLRSIRGTKRTIPVVVSRERKETTINVTLEDSNGAAPGVHPVRALATLLEFC